MKKDLDGKKKMKQKKGKIKVSGSFKKKRKDEEKKKTDYYFNQGRLSCDHKWTDAIDKRIVELEKQAGILELRKLKKDYRFQWNMDEEDEEDEKNN